MQDIKKFNTYINENIPDPDDIVGNASSNDISKLDLIGKVEKLLETSKKIGSFKINQSLRQIENNFRRTYTWSLFDHSNREVKTSNWEGHKTLTEALETILQFL